MHVSHACKHFFLHHKLLFESPSLFLSNNTQHSILQHCQHRLLLPPVRPSSFPRLHQRSSFGQSLLGKYKYNPLWPSLTAFPFAILTRSFSPNIPLESHIQLYYPQMLLFSKSRPSRLTVLAFLALCVSAQTYTDCNPLQQTCNPVPALAGTLSTDFVDQQSSRYEAYLTSDKVTYTDKGATFTISEQGDSPTVESDFFLMFGRVEFTAQAAPGIGIVSSMVLISEDLDEIDIEWAGGDNAQVQSNYFSKGDTTTYDRGKYHSIANPVTQFNTYAIDWTSERINWELNGVVVRTLTNPGTGYYPQSPMQVRFGSWAGGDPTNSEGTIEWAGGLTNYANGPYNYYVQTLKVTDYSTGSEYKYTDHSGSWTSIQAIDGEINGNLDGDTAAATDAASSSSSSTDASPSSTSSSSSSSITEWYYPSSSSSTAPSFTYVPASTAEESSTSVYSVEPAITTLVSSTTGESVYIITTSWEADNAASSSGAMTFEFSEGSGSSDASGARKIKKSEVVQALNFVAHDKHADTNSTSNSTAAANTTATAHPEQANESVSGSQLPMAMIMGSLFLAYSVLI